MVAATDVKVYKTTNNLGGAITGTQVVSATPNNLFVNVPKNELVVGEDYYACVYIKNGHASESMDNFTFWLTNKSNPSNTTIKWAFDPVITNTKVPQPYIYFDGSNDYIDCTNDATLWSQSLTKFSFSFWIYPTAGWDGNGRRIVSHSSGSTAQAFSCLISDSITGRIQFRIRNAANSSIDALSDDLVLNQWNFIVCVYDNSLASENLKIYINAVYDDNLTGNLTEAINLSTALLLADSTNDYKGFMKDFRWWTTKPLTQAEITTMYDGGVSYTDTSITPDYWLKMTEGTGNPVDSISGTKVGTLTNGATWLVAQTIADKYTAPINVTWNELSSAPSSPNYGKLTSGSSFPIWIWYHVPANAIEILDDSETFAFKFDIPQGGTGTGGGSDCAEGSYHYEPYGTFSGTETTVAEPTAPDLVSPFSISLWFRTSFDYFNDSDFGFGYMLHKGSFASGTINFGMIISSDIDPPNHAAEIIFSQGVNDTWASAAGTGLGNGPFVNVIDGQWHMLTGTYDGTDLKIYLDSFLDHTEDTSGATPPVNNDDMKIGGGDTVPFIGDLDEIRIWDVELTQQEISDLYDNGDIPQSGAIVYENTFGGSGGDCSGGGGTGGNPPPTNTDYKIAIVGDEGCEPETDDVIDLIQSQGYDHVISVGDHAYESASCWTNRFTPLKSIMNSAYGNHEYSESGGTAPYKTFFGHSLTYFTYKFENIQFFVCDTNLNIDDGSTQHTFMENALAASQTDNTITWRIAIMHHPWFGASSDHGYNEFDQVEALHTLFQNNGIRIVCVGHNHNWQRTHMVAYNSSNPTTPTIVDNSSPYSNNTIGLIHVVTGTGGHDSGGSLYALDSSPSFNAYQNRTHNGVWEIVASNNAQTLTCSFRSVDGDTFDTFTITA